MGLEMISLLELRNFQAHRKLNLPLDPAITTIVGPSDVGKSAILRALALLVFNRPGGLAFIHRGKAQAAVALEFDGHRVERIRSKSDNLYFIDGKELKAFGADVPQEILKLLQLSEYNFQGQLDPPFWFTATPGEVSRALNAVVDLSLIDEVATSIASTLRRTKIEVEIRQEELTKAEAEIKEALPAREMDADLEQLEALDQQGRKLNQESYELEDILDSLGAKDVIIQEGREKVKELEELVRLSTEIQKLEVESLALSRILAGIKTATDQQARAADNRDQLQDQLNQVKTCPLCGSSLKLK